MKVLETPTIFNDEKSDYFPRLVLKGRRSLVPKWRDFGGWLRRCMGIKVLRLEAKKYWKPRMKMLVVGHPNGEISDPRVLSIYLMFCTCLTLYFLNYMFYMIKSHTPAWRWLKSPRRIVNPSGARQPSPGQWTHPTWKTNQHRVASISELFTGGDCSCAII